MWSADTYMYSLRRSGHTTLNRTFMDRDTVQARMPADTLLRDLYTQIENESVMNQLDMTDSEVNALIGRQHTSYVWFAELQGVDGDTRQYRILRLNPHTVTRMRPRPGQDPRQTSLQSCQYMIGNVTVDHALPHQVGYALRDLQQQFSTVRTRPLTTGQVHSDRQLMRVYHSHF